MGSKTIVIMLRNGQAYHIVVSWLAIYINQKLVNSGDEQTVLYLLKKDSCVYFKVAKSVSQGLKTNVVSCCIIWSTWEVVEPSILGLFTESHSSFVC